MEIAIPLLALGGMYIVSNQTNDSCSKKEIKQSRQEKFTNMGVRSNLGQVRTDNYLPNTNIPPQNYPVTNINQLVDTVQEYINPNAATDKYFDQNLYEKNVRNHKPVGQNPQEITESVLDNMIGSGSQVIKKIEQAPLFKPEQNMQWAYGMPNQSDFFQSRVNPAMKNNNVKPFDSIMVGPGLDKGYGINGSNGYNSGMEARDKWLPKTVDQLRVDTNPKLEYELLNHEGPANSFIKAVPTAQMIGRVEKQRPDTFFINSQDRWLTTTGAEKGETLRPIQELGVLRRADIDTKYMGPAGPADIKAGHAPENFEPSKRHEVLSCGVNHSKAAGRGPHEDGDRFLRSHTNYENHRSTVKQPETLRSGFGGAIGAVIAPLMDLLKPTRKD